jgi:endogenous inhibitor of DNA gyrase (YacG/DUF329 family)
MPAAMSSRKPAPRFVKCPTCATPVEWSEQERWRPFCSERCKLIDLGSWFDESNRIPGEEPAKLPDDQDIEHP